jgi:hypothetical protein
LAAATKGNSEVAYIMLEAKNNEKMQYVIERAQGDKKVGERLATGLVKAKTADDVADAFVAAYIYHVERENPGDEEALLRATQEGLVAKYEILIDLLFSGIYEWFNSQSKNAKTFEEAQGVLDATG